MTVATVPSRPILPATQDRPERVQCAFTAAQIMALLEALENGDVLPQGHMEEFVQNAMHELEDAYTDLTGETL